MHSLDYIIFFLFLSGVSLFGASFYRRSRTSSGFMLGNKSIPTWAITMSIFATYVSSISFLALPGIAFLTNWNAFVFSLSIPIAAFFAVKFFVPLYRRINSPSAYTYLEKRFGSWARIYASLSYFLTQLMRIGTILYLLALTIHTIYGWNMVAVIIITGIIVMTYSILGGIQAVVWTDAIQGIILISGALVSAALILFSMPEGPGQLFDIANSQKKFSLGSMSLHLNESTFWVVLVYGIFINLQNFGIDQNYIQRYMACSTESEAKKAAFRGGMLYIPVSMLLMFIGTALFAFYNSSAGELPVDFMDTSGADGIFPYFIVNELPAGITGLIIASVFAAGMSTISTSYNSSATVFFTDYFQRVSGKNTSENKNMRVLYISSVIISSIGIIIALGMINVKSALDAWWKLASVFSGGMLGLFLLGIITKQRNTVGTIIAVLLGLGLILWISVSQLVGGDGGTEIRLHAYLSIVIGTTAIFLVGFLSILIGKIISRRT